MNLYVGQVLTWSKNGYKGTVVLKAFTATEICVEYNDKLVVRPIDVIGKTLFPRKGTPSGCSYKELPIEEELPKYTCKDCKLPRQDKCGGIAKEICEYFEPIFKISKEELDTWPAFGDATFFRLGGKSR